MDGTVLYILWFGSLTISGFPPSVFPGLAPHKVVNLLCCAYVIYVRIRVSVCRVQKKAIPVCIPKIANVLMLDTSRFL